MLNSFYTLNSLASSLDSRIRGWQAGCLYTQEKDELVISFSGHPESLVISCRPGIHTMYLHPSMSRAKRDSAEVLRGASGRTVSSVSISPGDRVVELALNDGFSLAALLYGPHANVVLIDTQGKIVDSFKRRAADPSAGRLPERSGDLVFDILLLREALRRNPTMAIAGAIRQALPTFGGTLAREATARAGLSATTPCGDLDPVQTERLLDSIRTIVTDLLAPAPRVYSREHGAPQLFSLIPLRQAEGLKEERFADIHEAIRSMVVRGRSAAFIDEQKSKTLTAVRQQVARARRTLAALEEESRANERAQDYERFGSLLMTNLALVEKGVPSLAVMEGGENVIIPLDVRLTPSRNAQRYFEKAKHARLSLHEATARRKELDRVIRVGDQLLETFEQVQTRETLKEYMKEHERELKEFGIEASGRPAEQLPFRVFTVEGGFEVWAGKSSTNNDLLTLRHSRPNDLWFHARGSSGSHVVLKTGSGKGEPGKKAKEQAASIAAYYSKMRHAKMVPVAMTERKYVRKPKGSPPGTVVLEREKVIFAEPGLPKGAAQSK